MAGPLVEALVGLVAGVLSGAFGVGGGIVTTPAIRLLLGYPELVAVGTPLPVIVPTAMAGAWSYARRDLSDVRAGIIVGLSGLPTTILGAWLSDAVGGTVVLLVTAALIAWMAVDTVRQARAGTRAAVIGALHPRRALGLASLGIVAGAYSGFLGLGGGFVIVPLLTRWFGMDMRRAIGTSLVSVTLLAVPGTIAHWWLGHVDPGLALALAVGVVPGALLGAQLTQRAADRHVRYAFGGLLLVTALVLAGREIGGLL